MKQRECIKKAYTELEAGSEVLRLSSEHKEYDWAQVECEECKGWHVNRIANERTYAARMERIFGEQ